MNAAQEWRPIPGYPGYEASRSVRAGCRVRNAFGYVLTPLRGEETRCFRLVGPWGVAVRTGRDLLALAFPTPAEPCPICGKAVEGARQRRYCSAECARKAKLRSNAVYKARERASLGPGSTHRCCDCGRPTPDHRCPDCLRRWREKHGVPVKGDGSEDYI